MKCVRRKTENYHEQGRSFISAIDLFCGAGGMTYGLTLAGIEVEAGIDIDQQAEYAYVTNNPCSKFLCWDLSRKNCRSIEKLFRPGKIRLLAGCAPCKPFSKLTNGIPNHNDWDLLDNFGRFIRGIVPEIVTMENVPELADRGSEVFQRFIEVLERLEYNLDWRIVDCSQYGVPQSRRRLVLLASQIGKIEVPAGLYSNPDRRKTVRQIIGDLRPLKIGESDPYDPLHTASLLSPMNLKRIKATPHDGGSRQDWPDDLVLDCHRKKSGERYFSIYGRMRWDKPAPTMTTLCTGIGNGRFGHPEQDRSITLREAALFQSFPRRYVFWPSNQQLNKSAVSRFIGNAVPPKLAKMLGKAIIRHLEES
jgi:DNA (cytosine-5)-methyltransferase 1